MEQPAEAVVDAFLKAAPEDGRHAKRVEIIKSYDRTLGSPLPAHRLAAFGQSPWIDDISDEMIASGTLKRMVEQEGVRGLTSNPSIFEKAIVGGKGRYPGELAKLKAAGATAEEAYEKLTTHDIAAAADILRPLYDQTGGDDGFVSLEVLPGYAYDEEKTVAEAIRLFKLLNRPNIMIKVPGTTEGIRAFRRLTAEGININVTLIFSRKYYNDIARAYVAGLKDRLAAGGDLSRIRSVASVFISRIDTAVDKKLAEMKKNESDPKKIELIDSLVHEVAIANTKLIYDDFKNIFYGAEFAEVAERGGAPQRPLWGSTSTKDPSMRDTIYVEELVGPLTVNTIPTATFKALNDHGRVRPATLEENVDAARRHLANLPKLGIDLASVCDELQKAGVKAFADSFDQLFVTVQKALQ
ncbi:transaldolase [Candidatus Sumerlaeota bacterium]|nr:transaldolase [Candidatus Sumerlaeota bacterium]